MSRSITVVVSTHRSPGPDQQELHAQLVAALEKQQDFDWVVIPHLYDLEPFGPAVRHLQSVGGDLVVLAWLHARPAYWVLDALGVRGRWGNPLPRPETQVADPALADPRRAAIPDRTLWCFDLAAHNRPEPYLEALAHIVAGSAPGRATPNAEVGSSHGRLKIIQESTRPRWYPVVDLDQCANCKQCLNFCLFGVYGLDEKGYVVVEQPEACRPGCPACARICPHHAIMFPQHADPGIAGDPSAPRQPFAAPGLPIVPDHALALLAAQDANPAGTGTERPPATSCAQAEEGGASSSDLDALVERLDALEL